MAIPEYADERAVPYFYTGFVGKSQGDNGTAHKQFWNSKAKLSPSKMILCNYNQYCAYCGKTGLPLQSRLESHGDYNTYGYTCVCKDSFDAREIEEAAKKLLSEAENAACELREKAPKTSPGVVRKLLDLKHKQFVEDHNRRGTHDSDLESMGMKVLDGYLKLF